MRSTFLIRLRIAVLVSSFVCSSIAGAQGIVDARTAAPGVVEVIVESPWLTESSTAPLALTSSEWKVNGNQAIALSRYTIPYDELRKADLDPNQHEVKVRHRIYMDLGIAFVQGRSYGITTPYGDRTLIYDESVTVCEAIKVNQVGYNSRSTSRFANFGVYLGNGGSRTFDPAPRYKVIQEAGGLVVASGTGVYMGDDTAVDEHKVTSGEHVYRLSLNTVPEGGPYYVVVPGCGRSRSFGVGDDYSREIARVVTRGLYHQRCGIALEKAYTDHTRAVCHQEVADTRTPWTSSTFINVPDGTPRFPIAGGYHDAGDFDRRPFHMIIPILMLSYFEAFPEHFVDQQYNIPESGNGIPDFLDEAMWSLLVWDRLQITDPADPDYGGVRMGTETHRHPRYGSDSAASEGRVYGTFEVGVEVTALSAGFFAQASRLIAPYDAGRSAELLGKARLAWSWLEGYANVQAPETKFMYAALQLYLATGDAAFRSIFETAVRAIVPKGGTWPEQYLAGNTAAKCQTAHFVSYLLTNRPTDPALVAALKARIISFADSGTYMGPSPEGEPYPQGVSKFMAYGAATTQGRYADVYAFAYRLSANLQKQQQYFNAVAQYGDFALGLNPLGTSFITGLGTDQPVSPLHLDSYYTKYGLSDGITTDHLGNSKGNVPGILIYGPTRGRSRQTYQKAVSDKLFPVWEEQPQLRRWGDGWSLVKGNEFTTWQTIVWNVVMQGFLYDASGGDPLQSGPPVPPRLLD